MQEVLADKSLSLRDFARRVDQILDDPSDKPKKKDGSLIRFVLEKSLRREG